jgi:hypothetical protein
MPSPSRPRIERYPPVSEASEGGGGGVFSKLPPWAWWAIGAVIGILIILWVSGKGLFQGATAGATTPNSTGSNTSGGSSGGVATNPSGSGAAGDSGNTAVGGTIPWAGGGSSWAGIQPNTSPLSQTSKHGAIPPVNTSVSSFPNQQSRTGNNWWDNGSPTLNPGIDPGSTAITKATRFR